METSFGQKRVRQLELCIKLDSFVEKLNRRDQLILKKNVKKRASRKHTCNVITVRQHLALH